MKDTLILSVLVEFRPDWLLVCVIICWLLMQIEYVKLRLWHTSPGI